MCVSPFYVTIEIEIDERYTMHACERAIDVCDAIAYHRTSMT